MFLSSDGEKRSRKREGELFQWLYACILKKRTYWEAKPEEEEASDDLLHLSPKFNGINFIICTLKSDAYHIFKIYRKNIIFSWFYLNWRYWERLYKISASSEPNIFRLHFTGWILHKNLGWFFCAYKSSDQRSPTNNGSRVI